MNIEAFMGTPLFDSNNKSLGIIVILDTKPIVDEELSGSLLGIFSDRISSEIERLRAEEALLESQVFFYWRLRKLQKSAIIFLIYGQARWTCSEALAYVFGHQ